ncbi:hypothetical protein [Dulcicalothrix desertica]|uniref:hypothetical protein n=1 Tax=Dulcicalothrix desertica TaxID=32056 RepID=UPI0011D04547|nr:hypothetical protein [Dulcicalothrix desertica]
MFYKSNILTGIPHCQLPQTVTLVEKVQDVRYGALIYGTGQDAFDTQWIELRFFNNHHNCTCRSGTNINIHRKSFSTHLNNSNTIH